MDIHIWTPRHMVYDIICASTIMSNALSHWGRVTHMCGSKLTIIGSDKGLLPGWRQAIIWTNTRILLVGPLGTNFSEILNDIDTLLLRKMHLKKVVWKMATILSWPQYVKYINPISNILAVTALGEFIGQTPGKFVNRGLMQCYSYVSSLWVVRSSSHIIR